MNDLDRILLNQALIIELLALLVGPNVQLTDGSGAVKTAQSITDGIKKYATRNLKNAG